MNKKGLFSMAQEAVLIFFTILAVSFGVIMLAVGDFHINEIKGSSQELSDNLYFRRLVNSENCFAYENPRSGRIDMGHIDIQKFTSEKLQVCSLKGLPPQQIPAKAKLVYNNGQAQTIDVETPEWLSSGATLHRYSKDVYVIEDGNKYEGVLFVETAK